MSNLYDVINLVEHIKRTQLIAILVGLLIISLFLLYNYTRTGRLLDIENAIEKLENQNKENLETINELTIAINDLKDENKELKSQLEK